MPRDGAAQLAWAGGACRRRGWDRQDVSAAPFLRRAEPSGARVPGEPATRSSRPVRSDRSSRWATSPAASSGSRSRAGCPYEVMTPSRTSCASGRPRCSCSRTCTGPTRRRSVLRLLARRVETVPALVVVSYRDDELEGAHPLRLRARRAALGPVDHAAEDRPALLRSSCGARSNRTTSTRRSSTARQQETRSSSSRRLPRKPMEIPDAVGDAVLARAARLSSDARTFLESIRGRAAARRGLAPGGARRPSRRECRRMSRVGNADG